VPSILHLYNVQKDEIIHILQPDRTFFVRNKLMFNAVSMVMMTFDKKLNYLCSVRIISNSEVNSSKGCIKKPIPIIFSFWLYEVYICKIFMYLLLLIPRYNSSSTMPDVGFNIIVLYV
jgi:hypothetical protein